MKSVPWIIALAFACLFIFSQQCRKVDGTSVTHTDTIPGDSFPYKVEIPVSQLVYRDTGSVKWRAMPVDTFAILSDYYSVKVFRRVLKDDSSAFIQLEDSVTKNSICTGVLTFQNRRATKLIYTTLPSPVEPKTNFYFGATALVSRQEYGLGPSILVTLGQESAFSYSFDFIHGSHSLTAYWRLGKRKIPP